MSQIKKTGMDLKKYTFYNKNNISISYISIYLI